MASASGNSTTQTPAIRTFQMDDSAELNPANSVNAFRGDVNLTQTLLSLPGRTQDDPLAVSLAVQYQSNVARQAQTWNSDAPTGILGLGWSLPLTYIVAEDSGSPVAATRQYVLYQDGVGNPLIRQPVVPLLLGLDGALADALHDGEAVPAAVRQGFLENGLSLSANTQVQGSGPWTLRDADGQQLFSLRLNGKTLEVRHGGELYQLHDYCFSSVLYYPEFERWLIVGAHGVRRAFGGLLPGGEGARGESILWSVWWRGSSGEPLAMNASDCIDNQVRVASAWYLCEISDRYGSRISCRYDVVEQAVGIGGLAYTKAIYLSEIVDVVGRRVRLSYREKQWDADPNGVREYADPHRAIPSNEPGPYQDRYETRYLEGIEVAGPTGANLLSLSFDYRLANATTNVGSLYGDTCKRFLTAITQRNADGVEQPPLRFEYDLNANSEGGQPGALIATTTPAGLVTRYAYTLQQLALTERSLQVERPESVGDGAIPRVFYGPDYSVVTFYHNGRLSLQVFTWVGSWLKWQPCDSAVINTREFDIDSLEVLAERDFLVLTMAFTRGGRDVYVYQRDIASPGQWQPSTIDGVTCGTDTPNLTYDSQADFSGGDSFFLVTQGMDVDKGGDCDRLTWRWTTRSWRRESWSTSRYVWMAAGAEYYAWLERTSSSSGELTIHYLDARLEWNQSDSVPIKGLDTADLDAVQIAPGAGLIAIANLTSSNDQYNEYTVTIAEWDASYRIDTRYFDSFVDGIGVGSPAPAWMPTIVEDTLIAVNGNLLRRTGNGWSRNCDLNPGEQPPAGTVYYYAYGNSHAIRVSDSLDQSSASQAYIIAYDPTRTTSWGEPTFIGEVGASSNKVIPSSNDDWAVIGPNLYFRGSATDWASLDWSEPADDLEKIAGEPILNETLVNEAPNFLAYDLGYAQTAQAVILHNGRCEGGPSRFSDQKINIPSEGGGTGAGISPAGPSMFITIPAGATSFDAAQAITLHHYAGEAVNGPISHYTVTCVELDNGLDAPTPTFFQPNTGTAACDPSGDIVKFYETTIYPGACSADTATNGRAVKRFLNGLQELTGGNYYDMLDGQLIESLTYAQAQDEPVARQRLEWRVFTQVASSPTEPQAPAIPLHGGWVGQASQTQISNGVEKTTTTSYVAEGFSAPYNGLPTLQTRSQYGDDGQLETFERRTRYGVEVEPALVAIHALADVAQVTDSRVQSETSTLLSSTATTYGRWAATDDALRQAPDQTAQYGLLSTNDANFPFAECGSESTPAGWLLTTRITARTRHGQISESVDGRGVVTAIHFDTGEALPVAQVVNAELDGCAYLGFQSYEDSSGWKLDGVVMDPQVAYAGTRSAQLPGGSSASIATTLTVPGGQTYVVGCRYRSAVGDKPAGGLRVSLGTGGEASLDWQATEGQWRYVTLPVSIPVGEPCALTVLVCQGGASNLNIDALLIVPLTSTTTVQGYDPDTLLMTATMDASGRTSKTVYDRNQQQAISLNPDGNVSSVSVPFISRGGNREDRFDPASPNATLTLSAAQGGVLETFRDGDGWHKRWKPTDNANWVAEDGALVHTSDSNGTLEWLGEPDASSYTLYFQIDDAQTATPQIQAGDIRVSWTGSVYQAEQGGKSWSALANPSRNAQTWLLVIGEGVVLFFADGQLIFSERTTPASTGLSISAGSLRLRNLTVLQGVLLGLTYQDGASRQRQIHQLHGADSYMRALVYDDVGRLLATTKNAPGSFGRGTDVPVMAYRNTFVDEPAFREATASTWVMQGDVADYYAGQCEGGRTRSNDEGYPYWGTRYEASTRNVRLEIGQPGKAQAINLMLEANQRNTTKLHFGTNDDNRAPAGSYPVDRARTIKGANAALVRDLFGRKLGATWEGDGLKYETRMVYGYQSPPEGPGSTVERLMPNALIAGPQRDDENYTWNSVTDALGRVVSSVDPDSGRTEFIYDSAGNIRFVQPALDAGECWFVYYKYDPLGRPIEQGICNDAWKPDELQRQADDPTYPETGQVSILTTYDGNGSDANLLGQTWQAITHNEAPAQCSGETPCRVTETYAYDANGRIGAVSQRLEGAAEVETTIGYRYDALGNVVAIELPDVAPIARICYAYDDQGLAISAGTAPGTDDLGRFSYDANGKLREQRQGSLWLGTYDYDSTGSLCRNSTKSLAGDEQVDFSLAYDYDGQLTQRSVVFVTGDKTRYEDSFEYDGLRRLIGANGDSDVNYSQYDANGNLWRVEEAGRSQQLICEKGSNRLIAVDSGDGRAALSYNVRGQLTEGLDRRLDYDRSTAMTTAVSRNDALLRFAYGSAQQRVLKQNVNGSGEECVYFRGQGSMPLLSRIGDRWCVSVQGPAGLLADIAENTTYPFCDTTGTVWAIADDKGILNTSTYRPFGENSGGTAPLGLLPLGFQGREWDAEVGLYNFGARLYDPALRRFLVPDPSRQFASPYLFAADTPLTVIDPTGELGIAARIGIGLGVAALAVAGAVLTFGTADTALVGGMVAAVGEAAGDSAVVTSGMMTAETATNALGGAMLGGGLSGLRYDAFNRQGTALGLAGSIGIGVLTSAVGSFLGAGLNAAIDSSESVAQLSGKAFALKLGAGVVASTTQYYLNAVLLDVMASKPAYKGLAMATVEGITIGLGQGFVRIDSDLAAAKAAGNPGEANQLVASNSANERVASGQNAYLGYSWLTRA